jgi:acyl-coenzyme A thioesterase PaaI-like protein
MMSVLNHPALFRCVMNIWPPFLGAGIHVARISRDWRKIVTELRLYGLNRNYMGTHFGGSLFAMTDPFYALMLIQNLGRGYAVWDKAGAIEFIKPVKHKVSATFLLTRDRLARIRSLTADGDKHFETFIIGVEDRNGEMVAKVQKTVYIRKVK